jgi:hypothetical protein
LVLVTVTIVTVFNLHNLKKLIEKTDRNRGQKDGNGGQKDSKWGSKRWKWGSKGYEKGSKG